MIIGIDPGLDGGIAVLDRYGSLTQTCKMPTEKDNGKRVVSFDGLEGILDEITRNHDVFMVVEYQNYMPNSKGIAKQLVNFGRLVQLVSGYGDMLLPHPISWQNCIFKDCKQVEGLTKDKARKSALIIFRVATCLKYLTLDRGENLIKKSKENVLEIMDSGLTDAACIAHYGYRQRYE